MSNQMPYPQYDKYPNAPPYPIHDQQPIFVQPQQQPMPQMQPMQPMQPIYHHTNVNVPVMNTAVGPRPQNIVCPSCGKQGKTDMRFESHSNTHRNALIMCLCCCWPCACLPYCMNSCKNGNHYCRHCHAFIGTYNS